MQLIFPTYSLGMQYSVVTADRGCSTEMDKENIRVSSLSDIIYDDGDDDFEDSTAQAN